MCEREEPDYEERRQPNAAPARRDYVVRRAWRAQGYGMAHFVAVGSTRQPAGFLLVSGEF